MSSKIRVLAVGGGMASAIVYLGRERFGLEGALVEVNPEVRKEIANRMNIPSYATVEQAMEAHDDFLAAYIATPNHTHADLAVKLAKLNIPVFMEKPLGINREECDRVVEAYRNSQGWLQIDFEYRFSPLYRHAHEIIQSGEIGQLKSIFIEYNVGAYRPSYGWRLDSSKAGGMFAEKLCHFVDLIRFWSRSEFSNIQVTAAPNAISYYPPDLPDNVSAHFRMKNGIFASMTHLHCSAASPIKEQQSYEDWSEFGHRLAVYLNTTEGSINLDIWKRRLMVVKRDPWQDQLPRIIRNIDYRHIPFMESHHDMGGCLLDFLQRAYDGREPQQTMEDAYLSMIAVIEADQLLEEACRLNNHLSR